MGLITYLGMSKYKSTKEANDVLTLLSQASGWPDHLLSRLSLARSLQEATPPAPPDGLRKGGKELNGSAFFHMSEDPSFLPFITAMIAQHADRPFRNDDEAAELISAHWHRGLELLKQDLGNHEGGFQDFLVSLARHTTDQLKDLQSGNANISKRRDLHPSHGSLRPITVPIGRVSPDSELISVTLNDINRYSNSHAAISGMSGSGKTQLLKQILASGMRCCDSATGVIFIDFAKGDVADDRSFVNAIGGQVLRLPGDVIPVDPFHLPEYSDDSIRLAAEEKREVYSQLFRTLGPKQQGRLAEAVYQSYDDLLATSNPAPDFAYIQQKLSDIYSHDGLQPDSLTELLRQLNAYRLFRSRNAETQAVRPLHTQRWVIDIHELGGLKEVTAFTLIEQLYREMRSLPESTVDSENGLRHIRCFLVIDEAQYYLRAKNRFLQGMIREGRSKGFSVMLMCQSPDDFDQDDFDYTEQLQFTYMLQCKTEAKAIQRLLGVSRDEAKRLSVELGRMEPLYGVGVLPENGGRGRVSKFRIAPFFEMQ